MESNLSGKKYKKYCKLTHLRVYEREGFGLQDCLSLSSDERRMVREGKGSVWQSSGFVFGIFKARSGM